MQRLVFLTSESFFTIFEDIMVPHYLHAALTFAGGNPCIPRHSGTETSCCTTVGNHPVHLHWNNSSLVHHTAAVQGIRIKLYTFSLFTPTL